MNNGYFQPLNMDIEHKQYIANSVNNILLFIQLTKRKT